MELRSVTLDDRYRSADGEVVVNGTQALLIAMMRQRRLDRLRGLNTAGFISGYRGSPLSSIDTEAWKAERFLADEQIRFQPGINEDLALTAVWGTQQVALDPKATVDGVFAMWYGKGAGLDRCGDVLRHAHGAGSSRNGGVLVVCGDDHALKSSSQAYHSEPTFIDMQMPLLYPADIQEMIDYAHLGWEMSRHSGCYVGLKILAEHANSTAIVDLGLGRAAVAHPETGTLNDRWIRWPDPWPEVERRLLGVKLPAAMAFARTNGINRTIVRGERPRLGVVTTGKSYLDLMQALAAINVGIEDAARIGLSIHKIGMPWPADDASLAAFCRGHETILVIEEKRDLIEAQVRSALYHLSDGERPLVMGRHDRDGRPQFPVVGELGAEHVLTALSRELPVLLDERRRSLLEAAARREPPPLALVSSRSPYFCSGCPHNSSTKVPEGSRALAGVGCHFMAVGMDRETETFTQMGGEGVPWVGTAPFTETGHVFVNLGEGTYFHSGSLAVRQSVAAGVNVTYKILFNDAIAMTGGQPVDGHLTVGDIVRQMRAEGVERIEVVADELEDHGGRDLPAGMQVSGRDRLDEVQRELRAVPGVSVLIYDQVCATEKRRRRKRGSMAQAPRRILINDRVCEGCGDCSAKSNCLSVVPLDTEFGRKRAIDQTNCNQDYSCVEGFCPSFVSIEGAARKPPRLRPVPKDVVPDPEVPALTDGTTFDVLVAGVGGTGVVTISALLGMAAHLEGRHFTVHDKLGMAQKYGSVNAHLRLAARRDDLNSVKIARGTARLLIGGDLRVANEPGVLDLLDRKNAALVVATEQSISGEFARDPDHDFRDDALRERLEGFGAGRSHLLPARHLAIAFLGDEIGANLLLVGHAWQKGLIPLSREAILRAVELNGTAVALNKAAFELGRLHAWRPEALADDPAARTRLPRHLDWQELSRQRAAFLTGYQDARYAARYERVVGLVAEAEAKALGAPGALAHAVAENLARLMAYKDEYEVARLFTDGAFMRNLSETFGKDARVSFHLAAPVLAARDPVTGEPRKRRFGPWMLQAMRLLAPLRRLRGTAFDPFGRHPDRREERELITEYEADMTRMASSLSPASHEAMLGLARLPERIRGYGHIKRAAVAKSRPERERLLAAFAEAAARKTMPAAAE